ncbi:MAG: aromatic ring-opening dioxygenase LigA, partial [Frankiales bacterium]|nr:aromatic ring-opening dioxygenase LigA [Frankiales bacterium]
ARFAGEPVDGPLTAYYEADIIEHHALASSKGKTYAELDREDPVRATVMNGSFLRASLFTSVVSFGVAAMAMGLGLIFVLIGFALRAVRSTSSV